MVKNLVRVTHGQLGNLIWFESKFESKFAMSTFGEINSIMQYENTIRKRKISENLFGPREGCVGPDYSASLSHLFLSLNHMHLSFLVSDFLHPVGLSDFGMAQQEDSAEDMI